MTKEHTPEEIKYRLSDLGVQIGNIAIDYIAELEKENAELKEQLESERDLPAIAYMQGAEKQKKKDGEQLTKAKEILKAVVDFYPTTTATILCEAEQFLSEVEK